jgi:hypothetical protein
MTLSWYNQMACRLPLHKSIQLRRERRTLLKRNFSRIFMMNVISRLSGNLVRFPCHEDLICVLVVTELTCRNLHMADFVTMINGFCGIMSIFNSLAFCLSHPSDYTFLWKALAFLPAGLLADFFDGKVARWRGKSSLLGQELDSLADLVLLSQFH